MHRYQSVWDVVFCWSPAVFVAVLAGRFSWRHLAPRAEPVQQRIMEVGEGNFDGETTGLMGAREEKLRELYAARETEK